MQYGAESAVVVDLSKRLGFALGMSSVECSLNFNAITLTTICNERCITTTRDTINQSINRCVKLRFFSFASSTNRWSKSREERVRRFAAWTALAQGTDRFRS